MLYLGVWSRLCLESIRAVIWYIRLAISGSILILSSRKGIKLDYDL